MVTLLRALADVLGGLIGLWMDPLLWLVMVPAARAFRKVRAVLLVALVFAVAEEVLIAAADMADGLGHSFFVPQRMFAASVPGVLLWLLQRGRRRATPPSTKDTSTNEVDFIGAQGRAPPMGHDVTVGEPAKANRFKSTAALSILGVLGLLWAALYFSGSGVLVSSQVDRGDAAVFEYHQVAVLRCRYFTGVGIVEETFPELFQRICPRIYHF